jgi:hypothetical protein
MALEHWAEDSRPQKRQRPNIFCRLLLPSSSITDESACSSAYLTRCPNKTRVQGYPSAQRHLIHIVAAADEPIAKAIKRRLGQSRPRPVASKVASATPRLVHPECSVPPDSGESGFAYEARGAKRPNRVQGENQ